MGRQETEVPTDLDYFSTDDLVEELVSRADNVVVILRRCNIKQDRDSYRWRWRGDPLTCAGICFDTMMDCREEFNRGLNNPPSSSDESSPEPQDL